MRHPEIYPIDIENTPSSRRFGHTLAREEIPPNILSSQVEYWQRRSDFIRNAKRIGWAVGVALATAVCATTAPEPNEGPAIIEAFPELEGLPLTSQDLTGNVFEYNFTYTDADNQALEDLNNNFKEIFRNRFLYPYPTGDGQQHMLEVSPRDNVLISVLGVAYKEQLPEQLLKRYNNELSFTKLLDTPIPNSILVIDNNYKDNPGRWGSIHNLLNFHAAMRYAILMP